MDASSYHNSDNNITRNNNNIIDNNDHNERDQDNYNDNEDRDEDKNTKEAKEIIMQPSSHYQHWQNERSRKRNIIRILRMRLCEHVQRAMIIYQAKRCFINNYNYNNNKKDDLLI